MTKTYQKYNFDEFKIPGESRESWRRRYKSMQTKEWRKVNQEKVKSSDAKFREKNKEKLAANSSKRYWADVEKSREYNAAWGRKNSPKQVERNRKNREKNPEQYKAYYYAWLKRNPHYRTEQQNKKRACTPTWADRKAILQIYKTCKAFNEREETVFHVDHIIPINGKNVCGLHVETNLRIITASENLKKSNKLEIHD